ncbi:MAG: CRISPR-associated CARF protein Csx1 [candidate division WOR-3 bacterium]
MKVLIATWGNPCSWEIVEYEYEGQTTIASTSLEVIHKVENPNYAIIVISDTLANSSFLPKSNKNNCDCYDPNPFSDYNDVKQRAINCAQSIINQHQIKVNKIIVSPGVGNYSNSSYEGNPRDFYHITLYELTDYIIQNVLNSNDKNIEIVFDITHGQNYHIVSIYDAIYEMAQILSYFFMVNLKVLYSEPVAPVSTKSKYRINKIVNFQVFPNFPISIDHNLLNQFKQMIKKNQQNNELRYYCFGSSIIHGLPYFIYYYMPDLNNLKNDIGAELNNFYSNILVNGNVVKRQIQISEKTSDLVKIYLISFILNKIGFKNQSQVSQIKIVELTRKLYRRIATLRNEIILEINRFFKSKKSFLLPNDLKKLKRNFFAHRGLLRILNQNLFTISKNTIIFNGSNIVQNFNRSCENIIQEFLIEEIPRR